MPERLRVKEMLVEKVTGQSWDYYHTDNTNELTEALDDLYLQIVDRVDWSRVLLIAQGRCLHEKHIHADGPCGQSLRDAMCSKDSGSYEFRGKNHYEPPKNLDWVKEVCRAARKRKFAK